MPRRNQQRGNPAKVPGTRNQDELFPKKIPNQFEVTILGRWYMAIKIYTQLRLTKTSDKLAAVAGVAREFKCFVEGEGKGREDKQRRVRIAHAALCLGSLVP